MISQAIQEVLHSIEAACARVGRDPSEVTLIAVSKTKPYDMLREVYSAGISQFGENKVQELTEKALQFGDAPVTWHMIGHLQKNKVKKAVAHATMIHSVDSQALAWEIQKEALKANKLQDILLEVNVAEEESKFGLSISQVFPLVREMANYPNLRVRGLMTVAPYTDNPETNRIYFRQMKQLAVDIRNENRDNVIMDVLSMGMSGDYEIAIEEGATHVRVGTKIFGARDYSRT